MASRLVSYYRLLSRLFDWLTVRLDIHITCDNVLVMFHDPELSRTTDGTGRIDKQPWQGKLECVKPTNHFAVTDPRQTCEDNKGAASADTCFYGCARYLDGSEKLGG